jgi:protein TonB
MSGKVSIGEVLPLPRTRTEDGRADDLGAVVPVRAEQAAISREASLGNVIPFARPRADARNAPAVSLPADVRAPASSLVRERMRLIAFAALSLAIHGGLFAAFWREPEPLASIGVEVISVELLLGATAPAGLSPTPGQNEVEAAAAAATEETEVAKAEEKATAQEQTVQVAKEETAPEQRTEPPKADERKPEEPKYETAAAPVELAQAERKPAVAMVETPNPDTATAKPQEKPPEANEVTLLPQPEEKPVENKPEPKPVQAAPPKPVKDVKPAKERHRIAAPTREKAAKEAKASTPSTAANNVGIGRSSRDTNYRGVVWSHLARYKRPLDGSTGSATVAFTIGGSGAVSGVRLVRGSGVAAIDQEVQAMVRRASPFPPPPGGRSEGFVAPINFRSQ